MSEQEKKISEFEIHSLAPKILADEEYRVYGDVLERLAQDNSVCNIALTGEYGSGKSSIVETFLAKREEKKDVIRISLRNFDVEHTKDGLEALEKKIIQQIICQLEPRIVHMAGHHTKQHGGSPEFKRVFGLVTGIGFGLLYCYLLTKIPYIEEFFAIFMPTFAFMKKVFAFVIAVAIGVALYEVYPWIQKLPWSAWASKLTCTYKESELSLELHKSDIQKSLFDTYLDEIVYLLQKAEIRYVVIEDLDRYDNLKIFEQLREINFLLNVSERETKDRVRFLYLLKDSIFRNNGLDRTKFFDAIIPVVPCIGESNAWKKLVELCPILTKKFSEKEQGVLEGFCSAHLDDYRMIKNIANEMQIMMNRNNFYKIFDLNPKKMLGMVIYRNVFPQDYEMLYHKSGYIYGCFQSKKYREDNKGKGYDDYITLMMTTKVISHPEYAINMDREYWESLKKHREYWMLEQLVKDGYIEEVDYQRYMRATDAATDMDEKLNAYYKDIVFGGEPQALFYETEVSREIWEKLRKRLTTENFKSKGILNRRIIEYMLDEYEWYADNEDDAELQLLLSEFANIAEVCPNSLMLEIFENLNEDMRYDWASVAWSVSMQLWSVDTNLTKEEIAYVIAVLHDNSGMVENNFALGGVTFRDEDGEQKIYSEEEYRFLHFLCNHYQELVYGFTQDAEALRVFLEITKCLGELKYEIENVTPYYNNEEALKHIWTSKRFLVNEENLQVFIQYLPTASITLASLKELDFTFYKKCMQPGNVGKFVKELYVKFMLPHVQESTDGAGSEEILQLLRHNSLAERYKTEILAKMTKKAAFKDMTKVPDKYRENVRHIGHSAVNMLYVLRKLGYKPDEDCIHFMDECFRLSKEVPELYYSGLPKELSEGEKHNIRKGIRKSELSDRIQDWILDELGIAVYVGDDDGIAG